MKSYSYPDKITIKPLTKPVNATIRVPPSKSITNRALILATLSGPISSCKIDNALQSDDTEIMVAALRDLGFRVDAQWDKGTIHVHRGVFAITVPNKRVELIAGNSGTTMRFLTAMVCLGKGQYRIDGVARMRERPMDGLIEALQQLGADVRSEREDGFPPIIVNAKGIEGGKARLQGTTSSQFLSALLMVAPFARNLVTIYIDGSIVSLPYVEMTIRMMKDFGVTVMTDSKTYFTVPKAQSYVSQHYSVEPDATSAGYFYAAAAITRGKVHTPGLKFSSYQGDVRVLDLLALMGCRPHTPSNGSSLEGAALHGITADMNHISDTAMTLAAVACFADSPTTIRNVAHIRHKECDRITAMTTELRKLGVEVEEYPDGWKVTPGPMHGAELETYNDHRIAMSLALIGLKVPGVVIKNPGCVAKTYPGFWDDFEKLYQ